MPKPLVEAKGVKYPCPIHRNIATRVTTIRNGPDKWKIVTCSICGPVAKIKV